MQGFEVITEESDNNTYPFCIPYKESLHRTSSLLWVLYLEWNVLTSPGRAVRIHEYCQIVCAVLTASVLCYFGIILSTFFMAKFLQTLLYSKHILCLHGWFSCYHSSTELAIISGLDKF